MADIEISTFTPGPNKYMRVAPEAVALPKTGGTLTFTNDLTPHETVHVRFYPRSNKSTAIVDFCTEMAAGTDYLLVPAKTGSTPGSAQCTISSPPQQYYSYAISDANPGGGGNDYVTLDPVVVIDRPDSGYLFGFAKDAITPGLVIGAALLLLAVGYLIGRSTRKG